MPMYTILPSEPRAYALKIRGHAMWRSIQRLR